MWKNLCDGVIFNEIAGIISRPATLLEKKPPPRRFTREYIRTFNASTVRSYMSSAFLIKLRVVCYRAAGQDAGLPRLFSQKRLFLFLFFLG